VIHYPELRDDPTRQELLELAILLCMINVPFEYGITNDEQLKIGLLITNKLLSKIHLDLSWWKNLTNNHSIT